MAKNRARYEQALNQGALFNANKQWREAFGAFRIAISEFPQAPEPYAGLGEACLGLKQLDKALECYKLAARYSRGDLEYLKKVADIQERLGQLSEAGRTYMAVGELLLRARQLDEAIANWQRAVGLESSLLGAHRRLAMVFQRQNNVKAAVREYLAIARILQMQDEQEKALQMCRAALRLDPENKDVLKAMELVRYGEAALKEEEEEEEEEEEYALHTEEESSIASTVRQMASILESEKPGWQYTQDMAKKEAASKEPVERARRIAQDQLAEEILREEEDEDLLYGVKGGGMSKLERDALIGQAMDFQSRGDGEEAINCYERAIAGGLNMPAVYFSLGLLYMEKNRIDDARRALTTAAKDPTYREASQLSLERFQ